MGTYSAPCGLPDPLNHRVGRSLLFIRAKTPISTLDPMRVVWKRSERILTYNLYPLVVGSDFASVRDYWGLFGGSLEFERELKRPMGRSRVGEIQGSPFKVASDRKQHFWIVGAIWEFPKIRGPNIDPK